MRLFAFSAEGSDCQLLYSRSMTACCACDHVREPHVTCSFAFLLDPSCSSALLTIYPYPVVLPIFLKNPDRWLHGRSPPPAHLSCFSMPEWCGGAYPEV